MIAAGEPVAPVAVDDLVGPIAPGQSVDIDLLTNDLDPDGNPAELTVGTDDPALADRDGATVTVTAGPTSSRHAYTITDPDGLTDTAEVDVLVVAQPRSDRGSRRRADRGEHADHHRPRRPGERPRRRHPLLQLLRQPAGRFGATVTNGAGELTVTFDPDDDFAGLASFAYSVDDQQGHSVAGAVTIDVLPPSNRPPVAQDTILTVEAGTPLTIDLAALVTDPDPTTR